MSITQKSNKFRGTGRIISIQPSSGTPTTAFESYQIQSEGLPASSIHSVNPILKPGTSTALDANAIFLEPTETYRDGSDAPVYSQIVINTNTSDLSSPLIISQYKEFFAVVDPGIIANEKVFLTTIGTDNGSAGTLVSKPLAQPKTTRKIADVTVSLTTSPNSDPEVAYKQVNWCGISYSTIVQDLNTRATSVSGNYKSFSNFLGFNGTETATTFKATTSLNVSITGESLNISNATASGVLTTATTSDGISEAEYKRLGIYRSQTTPFVRRSDGTQLYLKTNVEFS